MEYFNKTHHCSMTLPVRFCKEIHKIYILFFPTVFLDLLQILTPALGWRGAVSREPLFDNGAQRGQPGWRCPLQRSGKSWSSTTHKHLLPAASSESWRSAAHRAGWAERTDRQNSGLTGGRSWASNVAGGYASTPTTWADDLRPPPAGRGCWPEAAPEKRRWWCWWRPCWRAGSQWQAWWIV